MTRTNSIQTPKELVEEGVSIIGAGAMGAAYTARLSKLGVRVTIWNRTLSKADSVAKASPRVKVAGTLADCVRASKSVIVACSPAPPAIGWVCEQLASTVRDKNVIFIVDSGLAQARMMEELVFEKGRADSVTNAALFGSAAGVTEGQAILNASGKTAMAGTVEERVLPLLGLFGATAYHPGGAATAALFAMAGHLAFMPLAYGLMHYTALMDKGGVDPKLALGYFQTTTRIVLDVFAPMLASAFQKRDYSEFFFSHGLAMDIEDCVMETCKTLKVDPRLAELMSSYHQEAMQDPALAAKSFHSVHELIARARK